jgi:phage gpG-like protein
MSDYTVIVSGVERAKAALGAVAGNVQKSLVAAMSRATIDLARYVKEQKLTGQVLNVRTGRLRRSITPKVEEKDDEIVGTVGTNVRYARTHEFGFKGVVQVKAHERKIKGKPIMVRAHARNMDIPARPFLNPSLQERWPTYKDWLGKAVDGGSRGARA